MEVARAPVSPPGALHPGPSARRTSSPATNSTTRPTTSLARRIRECPSPWVSTRVPAGSAAAATRASAISTSASSRSWTTSVGLEIAGATVSRSMAWSGAPASACRAGRAGARTGRPRSAWAGGAPRARPGSGARRRAAPPAARRTTPGSPVHRGDRARRAGPRGGRAGARHLEWPQHPDPQRLAHVPRSGRGASDARSPCPSPSTSSRRTMRGPAAGVFRTDV